MTDGKSYPLWPEANDSIVVEEMLRDSLSGQWYECREFVKVCVQTQAKNIPEDQWEDIVQDVMERVKKSLPSFEHRCALRTWIFSIVHNRIIDAYRRLTRSRQSITPPSDPHNESEREEDTFPTHIAKTAEDEYLIRAELKQALAALQEYVSTHANPLRKGRILEMVLLEGRSHEETARALGCSAPVVGYVVRSAQRYVREKLGYQP